MKLKVLGSSSKGNCYLLESSKDILILECGISFKEIKKNIADLSKLQGVLITHEHGDHCKYFDVVAKSGFNVYASSGTNGVLRERIQSEYHRRLFDLKPMEMYSIGDFKVVGFNVFHDVKEPFGYLINHPECGTIMFATDTYLIRDNFKDVNHYLIEANYDRKTLFEAVNNGSTPKFQKDRVMHSHLGLETCIYYLQNTDMSKVKNIVLLHLSDRHSNAKLMVDTIEKEFSKPCFIADKGLEIIL